ncbi:hypothetical protein BGZ76_005918, partial [Entomortierella beljakovae]
MSERRPKALIVGAGLGAGMAITPNILAAIEQLGLLDELIKISHRLVSMDIYTENLKKLGQLRPADDD